MSETASAFNSAEQAHMDRALALAERGLGRVSPNPPVGCVLVKDGVVVGEGWHERYGGPHAEPRALAAAGRAARSATAFVTLMPCNHHGKTPPCTRALIAAGVAEAVVALDDPHPVSGDGRSELERAGIPVRVGLRADAAAYLMRGFIKQIKTGLPFVTYKYAMTLDGRLAATGGDSRWISGEASRELVQLWRAQSDAVLVGAGTALADDPRLNVRDSAAPQPRRVVVDSSGRLPTAARLFTEPGGPILILTTAAAPAETLRAWEQAGAEAIVCPTLDLPEPASGPRVDLTAGLRLLAERGVRTVLCEGGAELAGSLFAAGLIDELAAFIAPKLIGGRTAPGPLGGVGLPQMAQAAPVRALTCTASGEDMLLRGRVGAWDWLPAGAD